MSDYFYFLRESWAADAERVVSSDEETEHSAEYTYELEVTVTPETSTAGKVHFSEGPRNAQHYNSAENLVDVLIDGLRKAGLDDEQIEEFINDML